MDHSNMYTYPYAPPPRQKSPSAPAGRQASAYQNSSAFSASANPDEDWTKISDLAERRRIQNRIAQRNYRKKLKRRLEDLEKRTASVSPEQTPREVAKAPLDNLSPSERAQRRTSRSSAASYESQYSPDLLATPDEYWADGRQPTTSPYSASYSVSGPYGYGNVPASVDYFPDDCSPSTYQSPALYNISSCQQAYLQGASPALPSMMDGGDPASDVHYGNGPMLNGFDVNYASLTGASIQDTSGYSARTPPLIDSTSHLSSRECSPSFFNGPLTPESGSVSPNLLFYST